MLNEFIQRLMLMRQFSMEDTRIILLKQDQMLLDTDFVSLVQDINPEEFYKVIKKNAAEKVKEYTRVFGSTPESVSEDLLARLFGSLGFGRIEIMKLNRQENRVFLKLVNSPIVESYKKNKKTSKKPVCLFISAILAGAFSAIFKKDVDCEETNCAVLKGQKDCKFIVQEKGVKK